MPWDVKGAHKHKKGLSKSQAKKWARIANGVLKTCLAENKSEKECEARAIRIANASVGKGSSRRKR